MKKTRLFTKLLSLVCTLALVVSMVPALPAAAASTALREDFESSVGSMPGTLTKANLAEGGTIDQTVVKEGGNAHLLMTVENGPGASAAARGRVRTKDSYSGDFTLQWDMKSGAGGWSSFETYLRYGGYVRVTVNAKGEVSFYVHPNAKVAGVMESGKTGITLSADTWYTFEAQVSDTRIGLTVTDRASGKQLGTASLAQSTDTDSQLLQASQLWFSQAGASPVSDTGARSVALDNIVVEVGTGTPSGGSSTATPAAPTAPVAGGTSQQGIPEGKERWVFFRDNFDSYPVGEDAFYGLNTSDYTYVSSYHGTKSSDPSASYSLYSIANSDQGKALELTSVNTMRNWFVTKVGITGSYSVQLDIKFDQPTGSSTPGFILNPFQGYNFPGGKTMLTYFYPTYIQLIDNATTGSNVTYRVKDASGADLKIGYDSWYTVKLTVAQGKYSIKAWPQGTAEPASGGGVLTVETSAIGPEVMANANDVRIYNMARNKVGEAYTTTVDNLEIYKSFDAMTVPATLFGVPGDKLAFAPAFAGSTLAAEKPELTFSYQLGNPALGTINNKNELVLGPGEGQTTLKLTLADVNGQPTGASASAQLVVGTSNGITAQPGELTVAESAIGTTRKVALSYSDAVKAAYPSPAVAWSSSDESVARVAADGTVTFTGFGTAALTAQVMANGTATPYFATVPVQVGERAVRILSIGNSHSRDSFYYLSALAAAADKRVEAAFLHKDSGTIRHHAHNLVTETADYSYYKGDPMTGAVKYIGKQTIQQGLADGEWDIVMLHQGTTYAGAPGTYNGDIEFVADYVKAAQPKAKLYWMFGWAYEDDFDEERPTYSHAKNFKTYYDGSQAKMYNAFIDCFNEKIFGADATYAHCFDGWFPTGTAIQNLRATYGDTLTRDGFHLSLTNGRLTAAMTILKVLYPDLDLKQITLDEVSKFLVTNKMDNGKEVATDPDYVNSEANLQLIRDAVNAATADLSRAPAKLPVPGTDTKVEDKGTANDLTVAQATAPIKYFFPDTKTLSDGTVYVTAYKNIYHKPAGEAGADVNNMDEGYGTLVGWYSRDNGRTWSDEITLVDEDKLLGWYDSAAARGDTKSWHNANTLRDRYDLLAKNPKASYSVIADPRDPNLAVVNVDGKELLVMTFWIAYYAENVSRTNRCYMMWAEYENGRLGDWCEPILLTLDNGGSFVKRGDIAVYPNGRILVPYYGNGYGGLEMQWDSAKQTFVATATLNMQGVFSTEESTTFNEISFVAPPDSTGLVYAFVRESGEVVKSTDYGRTWTHFGNQDRIIHQPGFQVIDNERVFVTWARGWASPRFVYGKVMYVNGSWDDTDYQLIYASPNTASHDMGDPSSTLMASGDMLVVCYDTEYRSIVGTVVEVESQANLPIELNSSAAKGVLYEKDYQNTALNGTPISVPGTYEGSYTVRVDATLTGTGSIKVAGLTLTTAQLSTGTKSKAVTLQPNTLTHLKVSIVGTALYAKAWQGDKEPVAWTLSDSASPAGTVSVNGSGAALSRVEVSHRVSIQMADTLNVTTATAPHDLAPIIAPAQAQLSWTSSDPAVASVKDGVVTFHKTGEATITLNAGGALAACAVTVSPPPAQLTGEGEKAVLFADDFQSYSGANLWDQMKAKGYNTSTTGEADNASTLKLGTRGSDQYLTLDGKSSWVRVNVPVSGNYSVKFDFNFSGDGTLYATLNQGAEDSYATRAFLHLVQGKPSGTRIQYDVSGQPTNFPANPVMHGGVEEQTGFDPAKWYSIRLTRADDGLYVKLWEQGAEEPDSWSQFLSAAAFDTGLAANRNTYFRFQWASSTKFHMDNLEVSQQQGKGADFMADVKRSDWFFEAVDYAIKNDIMSGYNSTTFGPNDTLSRAMVVQVLYNKEGKPALNGVTHAFPDVPADQWFNNAVTWGSNKGVVSGFGDGRFRPDDAVTVEQVAVILHNYSGKPASSVTPTGVGKYDDWAAQALGWAQEQGILKDVPFTNATENATRAQTAQILMNFLSR